MNQAQNPPMGNSQSPPSLTREEGYKLIHELETSKDIAKANYVIGKILMGIWDNNDKVSACLQLLQQNQKTHQWSNKITFTIVGAAIFCVGAAVSWLLGLHLHGG